MARSARSVFGCALVALSISLVTRPALCLTIGGWNSTRGEGSGILFGPFFSGIRTDVDTYFPGVTFAESGTLTTSFLDSIDVLMITPVAGDLSLPARRLVELLQLLGAQGITQAQVARRANVPPQYVSDVRHGHRPLTELFARRLAEEFNFSFEWLLGLEDSREHPALSGPPSPGEKIWLPIIGEAIVGEPREHPRWNGAYTEVSGIAAAKAARAVQPYVLQIGFDDHEGRLKKGDFILVSQATAENSELSIVRCGKKVLLARKRAKWLRAATGEALHGDCEVTGHCLGVVWSPLT